MTDEEQQKIGEVYRWGFEDGIKYTLYRMQLSLDFMEKNIDEWCKTGVEINDG